MTTNSTFYHDGYRDGAAQAKFSPPDVSVYAQEYAEGYKDAICDLDTRGTDPPPRLPLNSEQEQDGEAR